MNIQKEAEQLLKKIKSINAYHEFRGKSANDVRKGQTDLILSSFERVSREVWNEKKSLCKRGIKDRQFTFTDYWQFLTNQEDK